MTIHRFIGIQVHNDALYQSYREHMIPIMKTYGGRFVVDVDVKQVRSAPNGAQFNRLFTIEFPDQEALTAFFNDDDYIAVRKEYFEPSVSNVSSLATYFLSPD